MVVILVTCPSRRVAEKIGRSLVEERLAACASLVPGLTSLYRWQGKICRDREVLLLVKTHRPKFVSLTRRIRTLHPYSVPEILEIPVTRGNADYLEWVRESTA